LAAVWGIVSFFGGGREFRPPPKKIRRNKHCAPSEAAARQRRVHVWCVRAAVLRHRSMYHTTYKLYMAAVVAHWLHLVIMSATYAEYGRDGVDSYIAKTFGTVCSPSLSSTLLTELIIQCSITFLALPACGAGSVKRYGVCPSVCPSFCPSMGPQQHTRCCRFAVVGPVDRIEISIDCCSSSRRTRAVPRCQRTSITDHRVVTRATSISCRPVSLSVCTPVGVLWKRMEGSS